MNFLLIYSVVSAATLVAGSAVNELEAGKNGLLLYRSNLMLDSILRSGALETCDPEETSCEDDKLTFCAYGIARVTVPCSALFDNKVGYCDCERTQCTNTHPVCVKPDGEKCFKEGKMPDPVDCKKFTYCNGQTKKTLSCPAGMYYNPRNRNCTSDSTCRPVTCNPKKILEYVPLPQSPNYYLFCYYGIGEVRECAQKGYSMQNNKCQFQCTEEGLFADPREENCKKGMWHSCNLSQKSLVRQTHYCGKDGETQLFFNEKVGLCLPEDVCSEGSENTSPKPDNPQQSSKNIIAYK